MTQGLGSERFAKEVTVLRRLAALGLVSGREPVKSLLKACHAGRLRGGLQLWCVPKSVLLRLLEAGFLAEARNLATLRAVTRSGDP